MAFKLLFSLLLSWALSSAWAQQTAPYAVASNVTGGVAVTRTETSYLDMTTTVTSTRVVTMRTKSTTDVKCLNTPYKVSLPQVTVTETATATNTIIETAIATSTSVVEDPVIATAIYGEGLFYRRYAHSFNSNQANNGFSSSFFKNPSRPVLGSRYSEWLDFNTDSQNRLRMADRYSYFDARQIAILYEGYFYAELTGTYTFSTDASLIDNWGYLWIGDAAYNNAWNDENTAYQAKSVGSGPSVGGSVRVEMNEGDAIPFVWLWANGGGYGRSQMTITDPNGEVIPDRQRRHFVSPC